MGGFGTAELADFGKGWLAVDELTDVGRGRLILLSWLILERVSLVP